MTAHRHEQVYLSWLNSGDKTAGRRYEHGCDLIRSNLQREIAGANPPRCDALESARLEFPCATRRPANAYSAARVAWAPCSRSQSIM